jgi:hypothetical protein
VIYIYLLAGRNIISLSIYISPTMMDLLVHHLDQPTARSNQPHAGWSPCAPLLPCVAALTLRPRSQPRPDRVDATPTNPAHYSTILIKCQLFFSFDQSFCYIVATMLSHFGELNHSSLIQCSTILATILSNSSYNAQPF